VLPIAKQSRSWWQKLAQERSLTGKLGVRCGETPQFALQRCSKCHNARQRIGQNWCDQLFLEAETKSVHVLTGDTRGNLNSHLVAS